MANSKVTKTCIKALGFGGFGQGSNASEVQVDEAANKVVRIDPLHIDRVYTEEQIRPWTFEKDGHTFSAPMKMETPPLSLVYKNRLNSNRRVPFPMKRVDWDPKGERNTQNRGISKYERISWDEAAQIIADEVERVAWTYSPYSILT